MAHAYDKIKDSTNCVRVLEDIYKSIRVLPVEVRRQMGYIPQMGLISTEVKNYSLAEKFFDEKLYKNEWIQNDPKSYNYRDHYYRSKSRIDIYAKKLKSSVYLDSFVLSLAQVSNPFDSLWYMHDLNTMYAYIQDSENAYYWLKEITSLKERMDYIEDKNNADEKILELQIQSQESKLKLEKTNNKNRLYLLFMSMLLLILALIAIFRSRVEKKKLQDISSQLKQSNSKLDTQLHDISIANKEIQHRTKNNLYLILSLLQMQSRKTTDHKTKAELSNAMIRIESIAHLNDQLTKEGSQGIDFNKYIDKLLKTILSCIETENKVVPNLNIDPIRISPSYNFPIGLILNEWITNSTKHAQVNNKLLDITIHIKQQKKSIEIEYFDNGTIPSFKLKPQLGSQIINLLTKQLRATLTHKEKNKFHYTLEIPIQ